MSWPSWLFLKDKYFDSKDLFLKELAKDRYSITDQALAAMRADDIF